MTAHPDSESHTPGGRRQPRLMVRIVAMCLVALITVLIAELVARPFTPPELVGPSAVRHDPAFGRALIPGYSGVVTIPGVSYRLTVNSKGFRGPEPSGSQDGCILFLGDSYTLGDGVNDGEEYAQQVAALLGGTPVVNAGLAGEGQGRWIKTLDRLAPAWNPSIVVMQFCANDFRDNHEDGLYELGEDGALIERAVPPETGLRRMQRRLEAIPGVGYLRIYALVKHAVRVATEPPAASQAREAGGRPQDTDTTTGPYDDLTLALTREAIARCRDRGWTVIGLAAQFPQGDRLNRVRSEFDRVGAPFIIVPTKPVAPELHHVIDDHWNAAGHRHVAELLADTIRSTPLHTNENGTQP